MTAVPNYEHLLIDAHLLQPPPNRGRQLGSGGHSAVFESRFRNQEVAVKRIAARSADAGDEVAATVLCQTHPNVVRLLAITRFENELFLVMERAEGSAHGNTLMSNTKASLSEDARLRGADLVRLLAQVASALDDMHSRLRLHHGDVAVRNVLVRFDRQMAYLSDVGLDRTTAHC
jgi:serine/threonine protein kinase